MLSIMLFWFIRLLLINMEFRVTKNYRSTFANLKYIWLSCNLSFLSWKAKIYNLNMQWRWMSELWKSLIKFWIGICTFYNPSIPKIEKILPLAAADLSRITRTTVKGNEYTYFELSKEYHEKYLRLLVEIKCYLFVRNIFAKGYF